MVELTFIETEREGPPSISDPGRILFYALNIDEGYEYFIVDYDSDKAPFWIQEGMGMEYFFNYYLEIPGEGLYLLSDVKGSWIRGDGWSIDDDEEWEVGSLTPIGLGSVTHG